jgi:hypothetical protein
LSPTTCEQNDWRALLASPLRGFIPADLSTILNAVYFRQSDIVKLEVQASEVAIVETSIDPSRETQQRVPGGDWSLVVVGRVLSRTDQLPGPSPTVFEVGVNPQRLFGLQMGGGGPPVLTSITADNAGEEWDNVGPLDHFVGPGARFSNKSSGGASRPGFSKWVIH